LILTDAISSLATVRQFAYRPPPERSRAPTPRPGTSAGSLHQINGYLASPSAGRPPFLAQANAYNRQAHPTPTSTRLQAAQLVGALPSRASTSQSMRGASVQPMPIPQPPRPSSSRTVFTNDPRDPRSFPRQAGQSLAFSLFTSILPTLASLYLLQLSSRLARADLRRKRPIPPAPSLSLAMDNRLLRRRHPSRPAHPSCRRSRDERPGRPTVTEPRRAITPATQARPKAARRPRRGRSSTRPAEAERRARSSMVMMIRQNV
jgi:hypothetical protein